MSRTSSNGRKPASADRFRGVVAIPPTPFDDPEDEVGIGAS